MRVKADYKVPGGKLVRVSAEVENGMVKDLKITGDFFLYPEETIEILEKSVRGVKISKDELGDAMKQAIKDKKVEMVGVSIDDFVNTLLKAAGDPDEAA